jgi:hypothetical protein
MLLRTSIHSRHAGAGARLTPTDSAALFLEAIQQDSQLDRSLLYREVNNNNIGHI